MIDIIALCDLHISDGSVADDFWIPDKKFICFLKKACDDYDYVVFVGDVYDLLNTDVPYTDLDTYLRIKAAHPELVEFITGGVKKKKIKYINGNHDSAVRTLPIYELAMKNWSIGEEGQKVYFEHGHHGDTISKKAPWLSRIGIWVGSMLERLNIADADTIWTLFAKYFPSGADADEKKFYEYIVNRGKEVKAKVFVCGHTHKEFIGHYTEPPTEELVTFTTTADGLSGNFAYVNGGALVKQKEKFPVVEIQIPDLWMSSPVKYALSYVDIDSLKEG